MDSFEGLISCSASDQCTINFNKERGHGVIGKSPIMLLDIDYDNWAVVYMCAESPTFKVREEYVWIMSRTP